MYVLVPVYLIYLTSKPRFYEPELRARINALMPYLEVVLLWSWPLLLFYLFRIWQLVKKYPGRTAGLWLAEKPVLLVLIYTSLIVVISPLVGPWTYNLVILGHFVGWYFYASKRLERLPHQSTLQDGLWQWFRGSVKGFQILHISVAVLFFVSILVAYLFPEQTRTFGSLVNSSAFYYWTVIHVTISFAPRS
jgi:hypothetical protein